MILVDTSVLSTFCLIDRLELLFAAFRETTLQVSGNVAAELRDGLRAGYMYLERATDLIDLPRADMALEVVLAGPTEAVLYPLIPFYPTNPGRLAKGEVDTLALAWTNRAIVVCNERKVRRFCRNNPHGPITCLLLEDLLRLLWTTAAQTRQQVDIVISEILNQGEGVDRSLVF